MIRTIEIKDKLYALLSDANEPPKLGTSEWYGKSYEQLQGSMMHYESGKSFKTHQHLMNPRIIKRTQECFVVISGKIQIDIFIKSPTAFDTGHGPEIEQLGSLTASAGEALFVYDGYHKLTVLETAKFYEIKAGSFSTVSEDKTILPEVDS